MGSNHFVAGFIAFAIAAALTICSTVISRCFTSKPTPKGLYEDKDGRATDETQNQYSTRVQSIISSICASIGLILSLTDAILRTVPYHENEPELLQSWMYVGLWIFVTLQRLQLLRHRQPVAVFRLTSVEAITFLTLVGSYVVTLNHFVQSPSNSRATAKVTSQALVCSSLLMAICGFCSDVTTPRRPAVYHSGHPVDGQWTTSVFSRLTYSWPSALLRQSQTGRRVEFGDLPVLDHHTRARDLHDAFNDTNQRFGGSIIKLVVLAHIRTFITQYAVTAAEAVTMLGPQFALYKILKLLEARDAGADVRTESAIWVMGLGLLVLGQGFFTNLMWFVNTCHLKIPFMAQLSALIFTKAMRRKDIKGVADKSETSGTDDHMTERNHDGSDLAEPAKTGGVNDDTEAYLQKSRQGVVNLIGVDAKRVSDFVTFNAFFFAAFCRLAVSFTFLGTLVGWQPLLAGLAVQLLFLPVNIYFSKRYSDSQEMLMKVRDNKLAVINEALGGIRQIKFSALEQQWKKKILTVRETELKTLWSAFIADTVLIAFWTVGPVVLSLMVISVYAILHGALPPSIAFTTISILGEIEGTLSFIPELTTDLLDAYVSIKRIQEYLRGPERVQESIPGDHVAFHDADITWPSDSEKPGESENLFALRGVNVDFPSGELSVISGRTGSGKSLLLNAILGEVDLISGKITVPQAPPLRERHDEAANPSNWIVPSAIAFVSQHPWIENATLKDNILFGLPLDKKRYSAVMSACALEKDLEILPDGDATEIGANGINLSGGQRWRVTLARALYSRAGILIMDDIFSAVDAHVGKHIFEKAITGDLCKSRTRILVTHHVSLVLPSTSYQVHLEDGKVEYAGPVDRLNDQNLDTILSGEEEDDDFGEEGLSGSTSKGRRSSRHISHAKAKEAGLRKRRTSGAELRMTLTKSNSDRVPGDIDGLHAHESKVAAKKFVEEEKRESGRIKVRIYRLFLDACGGWPFWIVVLVGFGGYEALLVGRNWILKRWTEEYETRSDERFQSWYAQTSLFSAQAAGSPAPITSTNVSNDQLKYYLSLYIGFAAALCVEGTIRYLWIFYGSIKASRRLFEGLTNAILRAPLRWLDTVPVGRVLNRFTADFNTTDSQQAYAIGFCLYNIMSVCGIVVAGMVVSPYIIICAVVLLGFCARFALYFISTARETKRLESVAKSPIFELFSAALAGVSTIRAFDKTEAYIESMFERIDAHARAHFYQWLLNRWLGWRLNVVGAVFAVIVAAIIVGLDGMNASLGGFALGFTLQYTEAVTFMLRNMSDVELSMNAVERIIEYSEIATEDEGGDDAPAHWPSEGKVEVNDLVVGYAADLPPVLRGLNFDIKSNERVGVVGRTGAGKSSLTLALFRFIEAREGSIRIDGLDISKIKLHDLRSRIAIIPQDPVLFSGTVRSNLDPFDEHEEQPLKDALERVHLVESAQPSAVHSTAASISGDNAEPSASTSGTVTPVPRNRTLTLSTPISESGLNLSQGQRQLLCLARAIVSRPKIMVLDEATSAVDKTTDTLIQRSIREEFSDATLLVIAHRLSTIADFDRILVMSEGRVAEFASPRELLELEGGVFRGMVESSGEAEVLREIIMGSG